MKFFGKNVSPLTSHLKNNSFFLQCSHWTFLLDFKGFIVSDGDPTFTSKFWKDLFRLHNSQIKMNIAYHPQIDGQTKVVNNFLETYLWWFSFEKPHQYEQWKDSKDFISWRTLTMIFLSFMSWGGDGFLIRLMIIHDLPRMLMYLMPWFWARPKPLKIA